MSSKIESVEIIWEEVKAGFDSIFRIEHMPFPRYMGLYSNVYNSCVPVPSKKAVNAGVCEQKCNGILLGCDIYKKLKDYIRSHVDKIKLEGDALSGESFLEYYVDSYKKYRTASHVMAGICNYVDRYWVKRERDEGKKNVFTVFVLALDIWREYLLMRKSAVLTNGILDQIDRERSGEVISTLPLEKIIQSLVELGISKEQMNHTANSGVPSEGHMQSLMNSGTSGGSLQPTAGVSLMDNLDILLKPSSDDHCVNLSVYQEYFEEAFLKRTEKYYQLESAAFLQSHTVPEYLKKVEVRLRQEEIRLKSYLHVSTTKKLIRSCENYLIYDHLNSLTSAFPYLLTEYKKEDIWRMYKLVKNFDGGWRPLVAMIESHVAAEGRKAMQRIASIAITDANLFIDAILRIYRKYHNLVTQAFDSAPAFMKALDKGCEHFINNNAVTELAGNVNKSAELLAKYVDLLLRKSQKETTSDNLDELLNQVMDVFKYLQDKDVFQEFYRKLLARRLVHSQSTSDEEEGLMISRLKEACGFEYTSKLQRMFQDVHLSRELKSLFHKYLQDLDSINLLRGVDCNVMVLNTIAWPYTAQDIFTVPPDLESCITVYKSFYIEKHKGRKLSWCYQLFRCEMITNYTRTRHTILVSAYQLAVLLLYNNTLTHTVGSLQEQTSINQSILLQVLENLLKAKILKRSSLPSDAPMQDFTSEESIGDELTPETALTLNTEYKHKRIRVNLNAPLKSEAKQETEQTLRIVDGDRKIAVEACIVRIMKTRRSLTHTDLVSELLSQIGSQFKPTYAFLKSCIEGLIERDYLKRNKGSHDIYEYVL